MDGRFWAFIDVLVLFTLGNSSDAFLMLRAQTVGFSTVEIFLVVAAFNLVIAFTSTKGGALSDTFGRRGLIVVGWLIYALIYLGFGLASDQWYVWILYAGRPLLRRISGRGQRVGCRLSAGRSPRDGLWNLQCRARHSCLSS